MACRAGPGRALDAFRPLVQDSDIVASSPYSVVLGSGGDDGGGPQPVAGVKITPEKSDAELGHEIEIAAAVAGGDSKNLNWYVNGVQNGSTSLGTITQNSPVTYSRSYRRA